MIPNASATPHVPDTSLLSDSEKIAPLAAFAVGALLGRITR